MRRLSVFALPIALFAFAATASAQKSPYEPLLERIPKQANVLMLVDAEGIFSSPMGVREGWREKAKANREDPLSVIPTLKHIAVAENLDFFTMNERWRLGMFQASGSHPDLARLASHEGGYVETISNMPVAFTPRGVTLFRFTDDIVGFVASADRQSVAHWIEDSFLRPKKYPPGFADRALFKANAGNQVVIAANLEHVISPAALTPWLTAIPSFRKTFTEPKLIAPRLASAKNIYLAVKVGQTIEGEIKVEFSDTLEGLTPVLRAVVMQTAEDLGIEFPELKTWRMGLDSKNQTIEMEGRLSVDTVRRMMSLASIPRLGSEANAPIPSGAPAAPAPRGGNAPAATGVSAYTPGSIGDPVAASQGYFRAVTGIVASLKGTDRPTYRATKTWYDRYAKQIDELPILNVDKDLLDWGSLVSRTLREMSTGINYYSQNQSYTLASRPNGVFVGYDYYYGESKAYDQATIKRQSDAMMSVDLDKKWQLIDISIADMRRKMVEKYKVDF